MDSTPEKTFANVSPEVFDHMKTRSRKERGTFYEPPEANQGTATTKVPMIGTIVLDFDYDPGAEAVTYKIAEKPGIVPETTIWNGIEEGIKACGGGDS